MAIVQLNGFQILAISQFMAASKYPILDCATLTSHCPTIESARRSSLGARLRYMSQRIS
jgi:hypothetical protein